MKRLSKAAIATGAAAVLLLGGAGTLAYWSANATATGPGAITSGHLTATDGSCGTWTYSDGSTINKIVPGDVVKATCTVTVTGLGDHLSVNATYDSNTIAWAETNNLVTDLATLTVGNIMDITAGTPGTPVTNPIVFSGTTNTTMTLAVEVTATFPSTATDAMDMTATLSDVVLSFTQVAP